MFDSQPPTYPVAGEISEQTWEQVVEGQPMLLVREGGPVAVIVDLESWQEAEFAAMQATST
jgi:prevent-host-death family protein